MKYLLIALVCIGWPMLVSAQEWRSGPVKTDVIELFTSEGCSSCPPADRWLSSLKEDPDLFTGFIPVAFHVDYWDYIGWKDQFAKPEYSKRQRAYVREGRVSQSYTPGLVVNSSEWRGWFRGLRRWNSEKTEPGTLTARLDEKRDLQVQFDGANAGNLTVALLGMGLTTEVRAGENRGRKLTHDFVVLSMHTASGANHWALELPNIPDAGQAQTAMAIWVTPEDSMKIIQATGGFLQ
ncbi:DUF1223 domain-containing protein [Marinobacter sp. F4206]|uniref:DUF1223 domain-containing protein n=1 Tax=Marinobacter sp. F4206 TaxID=2861777 RepID=UPI001C5D8A37|nr:DUF1223 domain-containing protein [Marinobacter sp. F4206]MBW4933184.1 DUF1223 domain-containing protein [Marinobacter sp. F4206]